jgi:hypothetical protein
MLGKLIENKQGLLTKENAQSNLNYLNEKEVKLLTRVIQTQNFSTLNSTIYGNDYITHQIGFSNNATNDDMASLAKDNSLGIVDLGDCASTLTNVFRVNKTTNQFIILANNYNNSLYLQNNTNQTISNNFAFSVFDSDTRQNLNLGECKKDFINIKLPIKNSNSLNYDLYNRLINFGINIFDKNNIAFNSYCFNFIDNSTDYDTTLNYRRQYYYQNKTFACLGSSSCEFSGIDSNNYIICKCNNIINNQEFFNDIIPDTNLAVGKNSFASFAVVGCAGEAFKVTIFNNPGFYCGLCIILLGLLAYTLLSLVNRNMIINNTGSILYNDALFADNKLFTQDEYFNRRNTSAPAHIANKNVDNDKGEDIANNDNNVRPPQQDDLNKLSHYNDAVLGLRDNAPNSSFNDASKKPKRVIRDSSVLFGNYNVNKSIDQGYIEQHNEVNDENNVRVLSSEGEAGLKNAILFDQNHQTTIRDYQALKLRDIVKHDQRGFCKFFTDCLLQEHTLICIFRRSLLQPLYIRIILLVFSLLMMFGFNAIFFNDDYIERRMLADKAVRDNFIYPIQYEYLKLLCSIACTLALEILVRLIIYRTNNVIEEFNDYLKTKDPVKIKQG